GIELVAGGTFLLRYRLPRGTRLRSWRIDRSPQEVRIRVGEHSPAPWFELSRSSNVSITWGASHHQPRVLGAGVLRSPGRASGRGIYTGKHDHPWPALGPYSEGGQTWSISRKPSSGRASAPAGFCRREPQFSLILLA